MQLLSTVIVGLFAWPVLRDRVVPSWLRRLAAPCCAASGGRSHEVELVRAIGLHQYLLEKAKGKAERYEKRLEDLEMQQKLDARVPRLGPHRVFFRQKEPAAAGAPAGAPAAAAPGTALGRVAAARASGARRVSRTFEWTEGWAELRRDGKVEIHVGAEAPYVRHEVSPLFQTRYTSGRCSKAADKHRRSKVSSPFRRRKKSAGAGGDASEDDSARARGSRRLPPRVLGGSSRFLASVGKRHASALPLPIPSTRSSVPRLMST